MLVTNPSNDAENLKAANEFEKENKIQNVKFNWALLEAMCLNEGIQWDNFQEMELQAKERLIRKYIVTLVRLQPYQDKLVIDGNKVLTSFPNDEFDTIKEFTKYHSERRNWGDTIGVFLAAAGLGYEEVMIHSPNNIKPPYLAYKSEEKCFETSLRLKFDIVNHYNTHWSSPHHPDKFTPGECLCATMANRFADDFKKIKENNVIDHAQVAKIQAILKSSEATHSKTSSTSSQAQFDDTVINQLQEYCYECKQKDFIKSDEEKAQVRKQDALEILKTYSLKDLIELYQVALEMETSDYLPGRLKEIEKEIIEEQKELNKIPEFKDVKLNHRCVTQAVNEGIIDPDSISTIQKELLHALSTEAWKDEHYLAIIATDTPDSEHTYSIPTPKPG